MTYLIISVLFLAAERLLPERRQQPMVRRGILTDLFHWVFNGYIFYLGYSIVTGLAFEWFTNAARATGFGEMLNIRAMTGWPLWTQFILLFLVQDFLMWCTHNLLHRVPFLWSIHRVHHSIETMDWIGNMRYHWGEIVVYNLVMFLPLMILGADPSLFIYINIFNTFIGHFNHANLRVNLGPLRYLFNSPGMHVWHHAVEAPGRHGRNFAIGLSLWDWIFRTAYLPKEGEPQHPEALGFAGMENFPKTFWGQQLFPASRAWRGTALFSLLFLLLNASTACDAQVKGGGVSVDRARGSVSFAGTLHPGAYNGSGGGTQHHHFIVWNGGKAAPNALIRGEANDLDVQRALESLGAKAGNNLTTDAWEKRSDRSNPEPDRHVEGSPVDVLVAWSGHAPVRAAGFFIDRGGKGFEFRLGGHERLIPSWRSGCIVCLESCPGGRVSNARYTLRDLYDRTARFDLRKDALPADGTPVTVTLVLR